VALTAEHGENRRDVLLTHARLPHMTTGVITVAAKSKRRDITRQHSGQSQHASSFRSGSSSKGPGNG
jgi:hypothetical protein